jgi:hypothetical protein
VVGRGNSEADYMLASPVSGRYVFAEEFSPEKAYPPPPPTTRKHIHIEEFLMATCFTDDFTRMRQDFDQAQANRDQLIQDTHDWVQDKASSVQQLMQDMHDKTAEMAGQLRTELQNLSTDLHTGGSIFRKESNPRMSRKVSSPKTFHKASKAKTFHKASKAKKGR